MNFSASGDAAAAAGAGSPHGVLACGLLAGEADESEPEDVSVGEETQTKLSGVHTGFREPIRICHLTCG
jgi:hypothetical protein